MDTVAKFYMQGFRGRDIEGRIRMTAASHGVTVTSYRETKSLLRKTGFVEAEGSEYAIRSFIDDIQRQADES